jgi:transposase
VGKFIRIGVDLAKNYFQVHALASEGSPAVKRKLARSKMHRFFLQIEASSIGMEACGSEHYWAREFKAMGHDVLLMPPSYIKPYVKRGKNDAVDAEAICEAMSRPGMRFVPIKNGEQQATLMLHKTRELLVKQRTMSVNASCLAAVARADCCFRQSDPCIGEIELCLPTAHERARYRRAFCTCICKHS